MGYEYDEEHVHPVSYNKGYEDAIKEVEEWLKNLANSVTKTDSESIKKFIHKKCLESPLNDIDSITNIVGLFTEFFQLPMISMYILKESIDLAKLRRDKNG